MKVVTDTPLEEWRKRLALAPEDVVIATLGATTQHAVSVEVDEREDPKHHLKSRLPFL